MFQNIVANNAIIHNKIKGFLINEKVLRLKYVRALEKFINSNVSYLKEANFELDEFRKRVTKAYENLEKITATRLDSSYLCMLENYANEIINVLNIEEISDISEYQNSLLKKANLLQKEKNKTRYKKEKHKNSSFSDGY